MKTILVFPCGSEIGLEVHRSLITSSHFSLIGASSVPDHGEFVYDDYIGGLPFHNDPDFIPALKQIVADRAIDAIYPTMDAVSRTLKSRQDDLGCAVIGSPAVTTAICASKKATYEALKGRLPVPQWTDDLTRVNSFPCFIKPDVGYGSRNTLLAESLEEAHHFLGKRDEREFLFCEYLPGREFTIDCFSDRYGNLLFHGCRRRSRVSNGISVNTFEDETHEPLVKEYAHLINQILKPRGAWFFQLKEDHEGNPKILEVAARLAGSSALFRNKGVNFALLSAFDAFDVDIAVHQNSYRIELDRALSNRYRLNLKFRTIYVDFDDCLIIKGKVHLALLSLLYKSIGEGKRVILLTRHGGELAATLERFRLKGLFDEIVHITDGTSKANHIDTTESIFIDDSFQEREDVKLKHGIPVFAPDMIEALL